MLDLRQLALDLVEQILEQGIVQRMDQEIPSQRRVERQSCLGRVPQQAAGVVDFVQRKLMEALPHSAKLESDVSTGCIGRHRVKSGAVSPGCADLQRPI